MDTAFRAAVLTFFSLTDNYHININIENGPGDRSPTFQGVDSNLLPSVLTGLSDKKWYRLRELEIEAISFFLRHIIQNMERIMLNFFVPNI